MPSKLKRTWYAIRARCLNKNTPYYRYYGGRGIKIEWPNFESFRNDMERPLKRAEKRFKTEQLSIDRVDPQGNYSKNNCRWVNKKIQSWNQRLSVRNLSGFRGVHLHKASGKWRAMIRSNKKTYHLGTFKTADDAAKAYDEKARELRGNYARTNF